MPAPPPRLNTLRERATKYREASGSLTWERRDGSDGIRSYILSLLPTGATSTRPLGRDLTKEQLAFRKAINAGKTPNRRLKTKREAEARQAEAEKNEDKVAAGRVSKKQPGRAPRRQRPSNIGHNSRSGRDEDAEQGEEADREIKEDAAEDDLTITPEEQAQFDALWEARRQRSMNFSGPNAGQNEINQHRPINTNPQAQRTSSQFAGPPAAEPRNNRRRRRGYVSSNKA
jgi:hypothetical protein